MAGSEFLILILGIITRDLHSRTPTTFMRPYFEASANYCCVVNRIFIIIIVCNNKMIMQRNREMIVYVGNSLASIESYKLLHLPSKRYL